FRLQHGSLHAPFDLEASLLDGVAVSVGGDSDGWRDDAGGGAEWPGHTEPIPAPGPPGFLERHAGAAHRQARPAGEVGDPLVDATSRAARTVGGDTEMAAIDPPAHLAEGAAAAARAGAPDHAESQSGHDLGDQLPVAVVADQDVHL